MKIKIIDFSQKKFLTFENLVFNSNFYMSPSKNLYENFIKTTKHDWEKAALKELQGKTPDSLFYNYRSDLNMPPIIFPENPIQKIKPILWKSILGTEPGIFFNNKVSFGKKTIEELVKLSVKKFKFQKSSENNHLCLTLKEHFPSCDWLIENQNEIKQAGSDSIKYYLLKSNQKDSINQIIEMIKNGIDLLKQTRSENRTIIAEKICFSRTINDNYLYEIALGRAQRIVWRNLLKSYENTQPLPPLFTSVLNISDLNDPFLIEASTKILSASIGGSDQVYFEIQNMNIHPHLNHLVHIFNILKLESGIGEVIDPVAGSYYLDELTAKISHLIWEHLKT
jgi:hypothetical protein